MGRRPDRPESPDVEIAATVSAAELRFRQVPETRVTFTGSPRRESASGSDRANLPERVKAAVTYRKVTVDYRLASALTGTRDPRDLTDLSGHTGGPITVARA